MSKQYKNISYDKALWKAMRYCAMQERCLFDVQNRFVAWHVKTEDKEKIIDYLKEENFLSEKRFVEAFVRGKFLIKKWGKNKIKMGLYKKNIFDDFLINKAFNSQIDVIDYRNTIKTLLKNKLLLVDELDKLKKRDKIYRYLLSKGYESGLVVEELESLGYSI